jgi:hypothetical protein
MDDEAPSFVVLCAAHAAKIPNYGTKSDSYPRCVLIYGMYDVSMDHSQDK